MSTAPSEILAYGGRPLLEEKIKKEAESIRQSGRKHASEDLKDMCIQIHSKFNATQKEICDLTGWSKGVVSKWMSAYFRNEETKPEIGIVENETETEPTVEINDTVEGSVETKESSFKALYVLGGVLSFIYLLNAEMNFYMKNDIETFSFIPIGNATFWLSMLKSAVVLSGILISIMAKKTKLLWVLSGYTFAVSVVVGWHNLTHIESKRKEKEEQNLALRVQSQNKTLFEMKQNIELRIKELDSKIKLEQSYKKTHIKNKAYGHVERCDKNIVFLETRLSTLENKKHETLSKIDSRTESLRQGMAKKDSTLSLWITFLISVLMKFFALCVKITAFSKLATG